MIDEVLRTSSNQSPETEVPLLKMIDEAPKCEIFVTAKTNSN
jgi:hypothetical protein